MRTRPKTVDLPNGALLIDINGKHSRADEFGCIPSKVSSDFSNFPDFQCALFDFVVGISASSVPYCPDFRFSQSHCYANKQLWLNEKVVSSPIQEWCKLNSTPIQMFSFLPFSRDANHSRINELIPSRKICWFSLESISTFCYNVRSAQSIKQTFSSPNVSIRELSFESGAAKKYIHRCLECWIIPHKEYSNKISWIWIQIIPCEFLIGLEFCDSHDHFYENSK